MNANCETAPRKFKGRGTSPEMQLDRASLREWRSAQLRDEKGCVEDFLTVIPRIIGDSFIHCDCRMLKEVVHFVTTEL